MSLLGPRTKSWRGWRVHVETSRMAGESDASVLRDDLLWPRSNNEKHPCSARSFDFFNRYSFIRIRLLPFVNMKCILCILSVLSSLMLFCSLSLSLLTLLHRASHPPRFACVRWRQDAPDWWGLLVVLRMRLLNAFVYVIMAASIRTASVLMRMTIIAEKKGSSSKTLFLW